MKNKILIVFALFVFAWVNSGCDSWLDVTPQAQVNADKLFSQPKGFENALYGIYTSMTDPAVYGTHSTFGMMDVLAQYYKVYTDRYHNLYEGARYNYNNAAVQEVIRGMWLKAYNSIANCNVLLDYLGEKSPSFFEGDRYVYLLAETKALRAYLHFDLLRAFAPSWKQSKDALCLPYADNFTDKVHGQRKTSEIVTLILADLESAREMLKSVDPAREEGFKNMYNHYVTELGEEFTSARAYRLNYWAITGLMARVYHYMGDAKAYTYAEEVIQAQKDGYFVITEESALSAPLKERDVIMQNEVLFALNFPGVHDLWYSYDAGSSGYVINDKASIYPSSDDFRKEYLIMANDRSNDVSVKYADVKSSKGGKIPMIRLSEMYLIAAESGFSAHKEEAIKCLKTLREVRGIDGSISKEISEADFLVELTKEARREFLGEGQMFYWYKRLGLPIDQGSGSVTLEPDQFCLPLPATEVEFGGRKEDYFKGL